MAAMLLNTLLVALGGGLGGMGRLFVSNLVARRYGEAFPWGTLVVNVSGAACIGVLGGLLLNRDAAPSTQSPLWAGVVVGMLGSYTTVSSFSLQTLGLMRAGEPLRAALNVVGSLALCLSAAGVGYLAVLAATGRT